MVALNLKPGVCCWLLQHALNKDEVRRTVFSPESFSFSFIGEHWDIGFNYCPWCATKLGGPSVQPESEKL